MNRFIVPDIFGDHVKAFFTGKRPGADMDSISREAGIPRERIYLPIQKHTDKIIALDSSLEPKIGDAVITREKGIMIGIQVADCVPILISGPREGVIGAVHAGWRGTAEGILKKTIAAISDRFFCEPGSLLVAFGPSIRWCCYGVDHDVWNAVRTATGEGEYFTMKGEKYCLDLPSANRQQALTAGVPGSQIWMSDECTFCRPDSFYSYRYARGSTGRQAGFIGML